VLCKTGGAIFLKFHIGPGITEDTILLPYLLTHYTGQQGGLVINRSIDICMNINEYEYPYGNPYATDLTVLASFWRGLQALLLVLRSQSSLTDVLFVGSHNFTLPASQHEPYLPFPSQPQLAGLLIYRQRNSSGTLTYISCLNFSAFSFDCFTYTTSIEL